MGFNGSGVFLRAMNWTNDAASNIKIRADRHDVEDNNLASGLTNCITRDGQSAITANLPMSGYRHTNVSDAQAANEYATLGQVINTNFDGGTIGGAVNAYTMSLTNPPSAYVAGQVFWGKINITNTAASTLNVAGLGVKTIKSFGTVDVIANELSSNKAYAFYYDGTNFIAIPNTQFGDDSFRIVGSVDATKKLAFEVDGFTTATTRTITVPNVNGTMYVSGGTDVAIADGGTGASTALAAFDNLKQNATTSYAGVVQIRAGQVIQSVYATNAAVIPVTSVVPVDDTVPTTAETTEIVTVAITPTSAASLLRITAFASGTGSSGLQATGCIFRDAATNASVTTFGAGPFTGGAVGTISIQAFIPATAATATTLRFRVGVNGARFDVNGNGAGARYYGGTSFASILVEEIQA